MDGLYREAVLPAFGRTSDAAFASSDRFFAGAHHVFERMARFGEVWFSEYRKHLGVCGTCDFFGHALAIIECTPKVVSISVS